MEWQIEFREYPNPAANRFETSLKLSDGVGCTYYHVNGGFKIDPYRKNCKLYTDASEIRDKLLRQLLARVRKEARLIKAAIEKNLMGETVN